THVISRKQKQIGKTGCSIRTAAMLRHTHGEENADSIGRRNLVGNRDDRGLRYPGDALSVFERVWLKRLRVLVKMVDPLIDELRLVQLVVENIAGDTVHPYRIGRGLGTKKDIGALGHLVLA